MERAVPHLASQIASSSQTTLITHSSGARIGTITKTLPIQTRPAQESPAHVYNTSHHHLHADR